MLERSLERYFAKKSVEIGGKSYKLESKTNGLPDRILLYRGLCFFVELKTEKGKLSDLQKLRHEEIKKHFDNVYVLKGKDEIDNFFKEVKTYAPTCSFT